MADREKVPAGALGSLKLLDFSTLMPGPIATMLLADLGADVIHVAAPGKPDLMNSFPPMIDELGISASAAWLGRNKRTIELDLKKPRAVRAVKKLVQDYDIIVEQFRPGVMKKLGLDYETLRAENPAVIYCSITGYGQSGPLALRPGHDINYMALSGNLLVLGGGPRVPAMPNFQLADVAGGSYMAVIAILAAVQYREKTGRGQYIDISMLDCTLPFGCIEAAGVLAARRYPRGWENRSLSGLCQGPPYGIFETADGGYMSVGALEPKFFAALCAALDLPEWADGRVIREVPGLLEDTLRKKFKERTRAEWTALFSTADACVEPVLDIEETCSHAQIAARGMTPEVPIPTGEGKCVEQIGNPIKLSESPVEYRHTAYPAGYHTDAVLRALGLTEEEIADVSR